MNKKPHILFRLLPPIIAFLAGFGFTMIHELTTSEGGPTSTEMPIDPLGLGFLVTSSIVVFIFPLLSRSWISSFLSPLLYFGALTLSSDNFFNLVGLESLWVFPADFTPSGELVLYVGTGIFAVGFVSGVALSIVRLKKGSQLLKEEMVGKPKPDSRSPPGTITIEPGEVILEESEPTGEDAHPFEMLDSEPAPGSEDQTPGINAPGFKEPEPKSKPSQSEPADSKSDSGSVDQTTTNDSGTLLGEPCATDPEVDSRISEDQKSISPSADIDSDSESDRRLHEQELLVEPEYQESELDAKSEPGPDPERETESEDSELDPEEESGPDPDSNP